MQFHAIVVVSMYFKIFFISKQAKIFVKNVINQMKKKRKGIQQKWCGMYLKKEENHIIWCFFFPHLEK